MSFLLSAKDIVDLANQAQLFSLPLQTQRGVTLRAKKEKWDSLQIKGQGGKGGLKTVYQLPDYVIDELEQKNMMHLLNQFTSTNNQSEIEAGLNKIEEQQDTCIRLIEERSRIGLSQDLLASKLGISKQSLRNYELGKNEITQSVLKSLSEAGLDVMYILLGSRSTKTSDEEFVVSEEKHGQSFGDNTNITNSVLAGDSSTINHVVTEKHITKTIAKVEPGKEHITIEQQARIQALVHDVYKLENLAGRKNPKSMQSIWRMLNNHCKVPSYKLIKLEDFKKAELFLQKWIQGNSNSKTGMKNDKDWKIRKFKFIYASFKEYPELEEWFLEYIDSRFNTRSKSKLSPEQLLQAYRALVNKKGSLKGQ